MIAWGTSIHWRVQGDTDPRYDAHPYLKGSVGDLWVAIFGTLGLSPAATESCTTRLVDISSNYSNMI